MTTREEAHERASGYAAGREDASGTETVPAPDSPRGPGSGWTDFASAYAQAQDDYNCGRRGSMTNCKAAYERWAETGGRTIDDEMDERAAAVHEEFEFMSRTGRTYASYAAHHMYDPPTGT